MIKNRPKRESTRRKPTRSFRIQKSKLKWGENSWSFFEPWKSFRFKDRKTLENQLKRNSQAWQGSLTSILRNPSPDRKEKDRHNNGTTERKESPKEERGRSKSKMDTNFEKHKIKSDKSEKRFVSSGKKISESICKLIIIVMHIPRGNSESPSRSPNSHFYNDDEYFKDGRISKGSKGQNFVQQYHDHKTDEKPNER